MTQGPFYTGNFREVACPQCKAIAGAPCTFSLARISDNGRGVATIYREPHGERRMRALAAFAQARLVKS